MNSPRDIVTDVQRRTLSMSDGGMRIRDLVTIMGMVAAMVDVTAVRGAEGTLSVIASFPKLMFHQPSFQTRQPNMNQWKEFF
jgi:hypothetical protein